MSLGNIKYDKNNLNITVEGQEEISKALGDLKKKTPAVMKVAINSTARYARKTMIAEARARYAVNAAGQKHLKDLVQRKKATNSSLLAELHISSFRNDLGYFETEPKKPYMGRDVFKAPEFFKGHVLKDTSMVPLSGTAGKSKGFLVKFKSGHVGMVQRIIGSNTASTKTMRGFPRWKTKDGRVEKLVTMGSPSATAMHNTIWPMVEPDVQDYLEQRLHSRVMEVVDAAERKHRR